MSLKKKDEIKKPEESFYKIKRIGSGYAIYNSEGIKLSEENMWPLVVRQLERLLRKDAGI